MTAKRKPATRKPAKGTAKPRRSTAARPRATPRRPARPQAAPAAAVPATLTRGERNCAWIETYCRVPEGKDVGKPALLRPWQRAEILRIYDNPAGTRTAILSFAKKNGKTALIAWLLQLHLAGPEAIRNTQLVSTAQSLDQAATLYRLAAKSIRMSPDLDEFLHCGDTFKEITCPELGTRYKALSKDAKTKHGMSPVFAVHDELGQVKGPTSDLYNAVETAMSAHARPMSIIISTQAPTDADLLSVLIDDGLKVDDDGRPLDPHTIVSLYTAPADSDPTSDAALRAANPAFGDFQNATELRMQAAKSMRLPALEPSFRNLHLNQRVEMHAPFVTRAVWKANGAAPLPLSQLRGVKAFGALDLSETTDLCAWTLSAKLDGVYHVHPTFWLPKDGLEDKARTDRVPYDIWHRQGLLQTTPGKSISYDFVAEWLYEQFSELTIEKVAFDRWNWKHFRPCLLRAGFAEADVERHFVEFGQGFQSMSPALRDLETALLANQLRHGDHPVLTMCAANAVVETDGAGNRKLTKKKSRGRIDGMVTLAMAHAVSVTEQPAGESVYEKLAREAAAAKAKADGEAGPGQAGTGDARSTSGARSAASAADSKSAPDNQEIDYAVLQNPDHPLFAEMARRFEARQAMLGDDD